MYDSEDILVVDMSSTEVTEEQSSLTCKVLLFVKIHEKYTALFAIFRENFTETKESIFGYFS